jgi:copper transport protein
LSALALVRRALVAAAMSGAVLVALAAPAWAHGSLESSDPDPGAVLTKSPDAVQLVFSEPVTVALGGVRVFGADGNRVATDPPRVPDPGVVRTDLRGRLAGGSYVVTWRVTSADTHPAQGAFTFQVGSSATATPGQIDALSNRLLAQQQGDRIVGATWGVTRWLAFAGIAVLVGGVCFGLVTWSRARDLRVVRRIVAGGWVVLTGATVLGFLLQGPYSAGLGVGDAFDPALWGDVADTRFGVVWLGRLGLLAVAGVLLWRWFRWRPAIEHPIPRWWLVLAGVVGVGIVASPALAGHAAVGDVRDLAVVVSTVHVAAMSVWLGGLVLMGAVVVVGPDIDGHREVIARFSRAATWCLVALVATGAFQTWRQVRDFDGLRDTDFGRILAVKLVAFAVMVLFAVLSRDLVARLFPRATGADSVPVVSGAALDDAALRRHEWRSLRRSVWAEVVVGLVVLAVTAALVNAAPPSSGGASLTGGATGVTMRSPEVVVDITLAPGVAGLNDVHVNTYSRVGAPMDVPGLALSFDLPSKGIAEIDVPLRKLGPGHYFSPGFDLPIAGDWRVIAEVRLGDVDLVTRTATITLR